MKKTYIPEVQEVHEVQEIPNQIQKHTFWVMLHLVSHILTVKLSLVTAKMRKVIQTYPWSLESLFKKRTKPVFNLIIIIIK